MKNMTINAITKAVNGKLYCSDGFALDESKCVQGVVNDNRNVETDYLFVPMVGARVDGHDLINDAFERGAMATLSQKILENPVGPYILVEDTKLALKQLAAFYRMQLSIPVIGVIGSVGKTSTKEMLASVLGTKYNVLKTEGNFNNEIGLPLTLCRIRDNHEVAVVEMGISDFGEMHRLGEMAKPNIVVMTNIGQCHLEFLKNRDGILKAKTEVFEHMPADGLVVLNGDDDKLSIADTLGLCKVFYGTTGQQYSATEIQPEGLAGTKATFSVNGNSFDATIPLPGVHNVLNGLAACAVGDYLGLTSEELQNGLEHAGTISGRNNIIEVRGVTIIDDCYNANPASMKASIEVLGRATGRTIAILGDMGELGENEKALHYGLGQALQDNRIAMVFTVGQLSAEINAALQQDNSSCQSYHYEKKEDMLVDLLPIIRTGDTILVKASHFMDFPKVVNAIVERFK